MAEKWTVLLWTLAWLTAISFLLERSLAWLFEQKWYVAKVDGKGLSPLLSFALAFLVCSWWNLDAYANIFGPPKVVSVPLGYLLTAAVIAGGSKGSMKLFQDVLGIKPPNGGAA